MSNHSNLLGKDWLVSQSILIRFFYITVTAILCGDTYRKFIRTHSLGEIKAREHLGETEQLGMKSMGRESGQGKLLVMAPVVMTPVTYFLQFGPTS